MSDQVAAKEYCYPQMIGETGDFLFISYIYQTKPALSLYNKRTKQVTHAAEGGTLTNDVDGFAPTTLSSVSNGRLVGYVNAARWITRLLSLGSYINDYIIFVRAGITRPSVCLY